MLCKLSRLAELALRHIGVTGQGIPTRFEVRAVRTWAHGDLTIALYGLRQANHRAYLASEERYSR